MEGILTKTKDVLDKISSFECIKDYVMIGGTALSLQIKNRLSEDIDFCQWKAYKNQKITPNHKLIEKELATIGKFERTLVDDNQVDYVLNGVKITFLCDNRLKRPENLKTVEYKNNVRLADVNSIGVMKLEVMLRRSKFRDYYDVYSIIKAGGDFNTIIDGTLKYSDHKLRTRDIMSLLGNGKNFTSDQNIEYLSPKYKITADNIEKYLKPYIKQYVASKDSGN